MQWDFLTGYLVGVFNTVLLVLITQWLGGRRHDDDKSEDGPSDVEKELREMQKRVDEKLGSKPPSTGVKKHRSMWE